MEKVKVVIFHLQSSMMAIFVSPFFSVMCERNNEAGNASSTFGKETSMGKNEGNC